MTDTPEPARSCDVAHKHIARGCPYCTIDALMADVKRLKSNAEAWFRLASAAPTDPGPEPARDDATQACPACGGIGQRTADPESECSRCFGTGEAARPAREDATPDGAMTYCPRCGGGHTCYDRRGREPAPAGEAPPPIRHAPMDDGELAAIESHLHPTYPHDVQTFRLLATVAALKARAEEAEMERGKFRTAASVLCGAHIGRVDDCPDCPVCKRDEYEAIAREADKKYHERREVLIERFDENNALEEKVADLEVLLADIRARLGGSPEDRLDGDEGLVAFVVEKAERFRKVVRASCQALAFDECDTGPKYPDLPEKIAATVAEVERLTKERDEARAFGEDAAAKHNALLEDRRVLRCAFCDAEYPDGTPATQHEALTAHVMECERHPLAEEKRALVEAARPVLDRGEKILEGEDCDCGAEGHICGLPAMTRELAALRAALAQGED